MNPDKQRIAIAEACGWTQVDQNDPRGFAAHVMWCPPSNDPEDPRRKYAFSPNYPADLNAMHEAERTLKDLPEYCTELAAVVYAPLTNAHKANELWQGWWFVHASAAQRAEAFLRTIGRWEKSE